MAGNQIMMYEGYEGGGFGAFGAKRRRGGKKRRAGPSPKQRAIRNRFSAADKVCRLETNTRGAYGKCMSRKLKKGR